MEIRPVEVECSMRTDGWTDMMKLIATLRNFAKAPEKIKHRSVSIMAGYS